jgi:hypothetical protein
MSDVVIVQEGILKGPWEEDNYNPRVEAVHDGVTYTYLAGSGSHLKLKLFKDGDKVHFVDTTPSYEGYSGSKYCSLLCPYCGQYW